MIDFTCPGCCADLRVADELAGRIIKCRECSQPCRVPVPPKPAAQREEGRKEEVVTYHCPFCSGGEPPVTVLRRVPLTLLLELVVIGGVLEITDLILRPVLYYHVASQNKGAVTAAALTAAVG